MLKFLFALIMALTSAYAQDNKLTQSEAAKQTTHISINKLIDFQNVNFKGILIGESIMLLDENFTEIRDISYLNEHFVEILAVSKEYYKVNSTDDYCDEFKYVKIKSKDIDGYIDGRKVYQFLETEQNKKLKIDTNEISFFTTAYYGIGISDDDGLTFCSSNNPVIFKAKNENFEGLVKMIRNENYKEGYPYFELRADEGAYDEIKNIQKQADKYLINIEREYQEGRANISVAIFKNREGIYFAEIIKHQVIEE